MKSRHFFLLPFSLFLLSAPAAETVSGSYNTSLGYLAGKDASGERVTVMGAGAGGAMTGALRTDLLGAASGVRSANLTDCVGIGYRALRGSSNMTSVVAIGSRAFENRTGVSDATWINGQFYAEGGTCFIKPDPSMADEDAPIYYTGGNLYLNAGNIYIKGGASKISATNDVDDLASAGYAVFVSQSSGSDYNDGKTEETPVKTLDKAFALAASGDAIAVRAGSYTYPRALAEAGYRDGSGKRVTFRGVDGAARTLMVKGAGDSKDGKIIGATSGMTTFANWTFKYVKPVPRGNPTIPYIFVRFRDCVFDGLVSTNTGYGSTWAVCLLERCAIRNCSFVNGGGGSPTWLDFNPSLFADCVVTDTSIDATLSGGLHLTNGSHFENCWARFAGSAGTFDLNSTQTGTGYSSTPLKSPNFGTLSGWVDSTVLVESPGSLALSARTYEWYMLPHRFVGCLVGLGADSAYTNAVAANVSDSVLTNCADVAALTDGAFSRVSREADKRLYYYGYGAATDRKTKDIVSEDVLSLLAEAEETPAAVRTLATARLASMAAAEEARAEATTNMVNGAYSPPSGGLTLSAPTHEGADDEEDEEETETSTE